MVDMIVKNKNDETYFIITAEGEIHLAKMSIGQSGFINYEDIIYHELTRHDIHKILRHGKNEEYVLLEKVEHLPLHVDELSDEYMNQ